MSSRSIGGALDTRALEALAGVDSRRMANFTSLDQAGQEDAIRRLAKIGHSDHSIARATGWSVEAVRQIIGDRAR